MPLYIVPGDRLIVPQDVEQKDVIAATKRHSHWKTYERLIQTYEDGVGWVLTNGGRITWTKTGALFGHRSPLAHKDIEHLWETLIAAVGDDRLCVIAAGTFLQLTIARRPETWLGTPVETDKVDPLTGKTIFTYEYWLEPNYMPPHLARPRPTVDDLKAKWGSR